MNTAKITRTAEGYTLSLNKTFIKTFKTLDGAMNAMSKLDITNKPTGISRRVNLVKQVNRREG